MNAAIRVGLLTACLLVPTLGVRSWIRAAERRSDEASARPVTSANAVAVAAASDEGYCSPELRRILRRVLTSCGLIGGSSARGCQPAQARDVATLSGGDFNALFQPMRDRGGIVQFAADHADLDPGALQLIDRVFSDQRGASYFFVVARASPEGSVEHNRELSRARANAVMAHLRETFHDPDLEHEVGLLWLGEEFAQLDQQFCQWRRSAGASCEPTDINRSAFIAWIDCRL